MFVTFEGLDGCGKTTQAVLLADALRGDGVEVVSTREPGGTPLGEAIRDLVLHGGHVAPWAEAALYAASRAQHVDGVIRPALERGATVVCDRYIDSSVAYQGVGRVLDPEAVRSLSEWATEGLAPDLTILLDLDADAARGRLDEARTRYDRLEAEASEFHDRVRAAYLALAEAEPDRFLVVDAARPVDEIAGDIRGRVAHLL